MKKSLKHAIVMLNSFQYPCVFTKKKSSAFTLVEIMVVMVLMGVLLAITVPHFRGMTHTRNLVDAAKMVESELIRSFSLARSEGTSVGLILETVGGTQLFRCEYDGTSGCDSTTKTPLLIDDAILGDAFSIEVDEEKEIFFRAPHGDIIDNASFSGDPNIATIKITHTKSNDIRTLTLYQLSGLIEIGK